MNEYPLILSIETATRGGSVCITQGKTVLATSTGDPDLSHSNTVLSDIDSCLREAGVSVNDVRLFAAASGPGSFTGLRIGLATIKGFAATLKRPCVGVPTLQAIAHAGGESKATVALLPAGRGELFVQRFMVADDEVTEFDEAAHLPPERALEKYDSIQSLAWTGPGAEMQRGLITDRATEAGKDWKIIVQPEGELAKHVAAIAQQRFQRGQLDSAETLSAIYVRPSDAELKCK